MTEQKKPLNVLLVEDQEDDAALLLRELARQGYQVTHRRVETAEAFEEALREPWDVVLSDHSLPSFSAPAALELLQRSGRDLPFIIVSGTIGEDVAVEALRAGAHDFMVKARLARLSPAIERELREVETRKQRREAEAQLLVSDRMAAIGTLAAGVAHEINNPLAAVLANLELAEKELEQIATSGSLERLAAARDELHEALEAAARVREIVRDLKVFSRGEEEQRHPVDVNHVLESSLRIAWNEVRHRAKVVKSYADVPPVLATEGRLGQVFLNIIVNAAQALDERRVGRNELRLSTRLEQARVLVEIADTGSGIPPEVLKRLFTPFVTTKPTGVGTGLGLSICHRIVTGLGGDIQVDSRPGAGSVFRVWLPSTTQVLRPLERPAAPARPAARKGAILVVDDEPIIARVIQRILAPRHQVAIAAHAQDALARLEAGERFDVILCDLMMPEMTGMDLHEVLAQRAPDQAERMVFMTGGAFTTRALQFLDEVARRRLEKPFDAEQLERAVGELLAG